MLKGKRFYADTETTGVDAKRCGIIQLSGELYIDGVMKERINIKMQPFPNDEITDEALECNGITREELFSPTRMKPKEAYERFIGLLDPHIAKFDRGDKAFWIGYKSQFDFDFMWSWFEKNEDKYFGSWFFAPPLCMMNLAAFLLQGQRKEMKDFKLKTVWEKLHEDKVTLYNEDDWHDAIFDIQRTIEVEDALRRLVVDVKENTLQKRLEEALEKERVIWAAQKEFNAEKVEEPPPATKHKPLKLS